MLFATAATATEVTALTTVLASVFDYLMGQLGDLATLILETPLLLIPIGISLAFVAVKFFKYIFRY